MQFLRIMFSISILYSIAFSSWLLQTKDINFTKERKWSGKEITVVPRERKIPVKDNTIAFETNNFGVLYYSLKYVSNLFLVLY